MSRKQFCADAALVVITSIAIVLFLKEAYVLRDMEAQRHKDADQEYAFREHCMAYRAGAIGLAVLCAWCNLRRQERENGDVLLTVGGTMLIFVAATLLFTEDLSPTTFINTVWTGVILTVAGVVWQILGGPDSG